MVVGVETGVMFVGGCDRDRQRSDHRKDEEQQSLDRAEDHEDRYEGERDKSPADEGTSQARVVSTDSVGPRVGR